VPGAGRASGRVPVAYRRGEGYVRGRRPYRQSPDITSPP